MRRRKFLRNIALLGLGGSSLYTGTKWYQWHKEPDIAYLEKQHELLAAIADTIIPATDTPGASAAGVQDFIIKVVKDCATVTSQNKFIDGLKEIEKYSISSYQQPFNKCSRTQQTNILKHFDNSYSTTNDTLKKIKNRLFGKPFFTLLKEYTTEGYCTSELGATKGLSYLMIPGAYHGKVPLLPGQRTWATK